MTARDIYARWASGEFNGKWRDCRCEGCVVARTPTVTNTAVGIGTAVLVKAKKISGLHPRITGIIERLQTDRGRITLAGNFQFIAAAQNLFRGDAFLRV